MDEIWWTTSASADGTKDPNCKSLSDLGVEKLRVAQLGRGSQKFCICTFFRGESLVQVSGIFLRCYDTLWNAF